MIFYAADNNSVVVQSMQGAVVGAVHCNKLRWVEVQALCREVGQMYSRWLVICKSVHGPAIGISTAGNEPFQPRRKTMATICCSSQPLNKARKCRTMVQLRCFPMTKHFTHTYQSHQSRQMKFIDQSQSCGAQVAMWWA